MLFLYPDYYFHRIWELEPQWLQDHKIKVLLLDVDNTLTTHNNPDVPDEVGQWLQEVRRAGIRLLILSNNKAKRVAPFAKKLGIDYIANAAKPLGFGVWYAMKHLRADSRYLAVVGDQLFTDVLCAKSTGVISILVEPIRKEPFLFLRMKRRLERIVLKNYHKGDRL